ncbi:MAG: GerMN domain-containing protein [Actinobacteria bacterium]|nr:GerMN domain-containing protein [Actinomycetota bacterium]
MVSAAAFVAACGGGSGGSSPTPAVTVVTATPTASHSPTTAPTATPSSTSTLSPYFLRGEELGVAERRVPHTTRLATAAMEALLAGPTSAERTAGLTTAVPDGTRLIGVRIQHGVATVDLSDAFASGGGSLSMQARVAQIVYTLTRFPTVKAVDFRLDGAIVETLGGEGLILDAGQTRADWRDFEPAIFVERPGIGAVLSSPFILEGTASVFEGSFAARLVDGAGHSIVRTQVQASAGAPGRGRFRTTISFSTTAQSGTLIVYSQSMEDGSRQNEVRIPVGFSSD